MSKIKVIEVITRLNIGGSASHVIFLTAGLDPDQFETTLITGKEGTYEGNMMDLATAKGIQPVVLPSLQRELNPRQDSIALRALCDFFRQERPDIVHTHTAKAGTLGRVAALLTGVPVVLHTFHGHTFYGYFGPLKTSTFLNIERVLARFTDRIIAVSESLRRELVEEYHVAAPQKLVAIPLGFELGEYLACESLRGELRRELAITDDTRLIGIIARLTPIKAPQLFLDVARRVRQERPDVQFLLVGGGEMRELLEGSARKMGLTGIVRFLGWRRDLPRLYADLDVVVLTSKNEGTPVSLIEAMASGVPVVSTNVGGVPDIVVDGVNGYLVPPGDEDALTVAILDLLNRPARASVMGQEGRRSVRLQYTVERLVNDMDNLYKELLESKRPQARRPALTKHNFNRLAPTAQEDDLER
jgi:glycosyltransferase involved in cell wall biosynthesis